jgi:peptidase M15-like protein
MSRFSMQILLLALVAIALAACGSQTSTPAASDPAPARTADPASDTAPVPRSHPQAIEPAAGVQAVPSAGGGAQIVGDVNAHAPPLSQIKRELNQLNLCGGAVTAAEATPIVKSSAPGFVADPGTIQDVGQLPELTGQLNALGKALEVTIYGISGYRTPAHSVAVGGYADDPHTKGEAEDIGVNSLLRSSAAQISEPELARYGLYRPFDPTDDPNNTEVNHVQLIPHSGPLTLTESTATFDTDPLCK